MERLFNSFLALPPGKDFLLLPLGHVLIFLFVISLCLLLGKHKTGLLITYCFVFYWGFASNRDYFIDLLSDTGGGMIIYVFTAVVMVAVFVIGFFHSSRD